jgi:hypothetical protein
MPKNTIQLAVVLMTMASYAFGPVWLTLTLVMACVFALFIRSQRDAFIADVILWSCATAFAAVLSGAATAQVIFLIGCAAILIEYMLMGLSPIYIEGQKSEDYEGFNDYDD